MSVTLMSRIRHEVQPTKGSRFLVTAAAVADEDEARRLLAGVAVEMADASHHCWAWRLARPAIDRAGDDGEPGGSAGRPILAQLTGRDVVDAAVIVTRYFGGTKLGVGGLVRAYGGAAGEALDLATLIEHRTMIDLVVTHGYADERVVNDAIERVSGVTVDVVYGVDVRRVVRLPEGDVELFGRTVLDATAGRAVVGDVGAGE